LWVETNDFLKNKQKTINIVCDYFEINRVKNFELSNFYVKSFGLIGKKNPINEVTIPNLGEVKTLYPSYGIVDDMMSSHFDDINTIISFVKGEILDIPHKLL
jgi:hypothetical protein